MSTNTDPSIAGLVAKFYLPVASDRDTVPLPQRTGEESVMYPDLRLLVDAKLYCDGGFYRSIVKLQIKMSFKIPGKDHIIYKWYMGTGWLITPDIMVTAGHNVCKWDEEIEDIVGKATMIKCHIGYHGKKFIREKSVQTRHAKCCVIPAEWLHSKKNQHRDFAFIQVDEAFEGDLQLFSYKQTPLSGSEDLEVVGYPGDRSIRGRHGREELGAQMYKDSKLEHYDRKKTALEMLTHTLSTFPGSSGSPVILKDTHTVIATHVRGCGGWNKASQITDYDNFLRVMKRRFTVVKEIQGIALHDPAEQRLPPQPKVTKPAKIRGRAPGCPKSSK